MGAPVLLFDSGLGGLSVLRELRIKLPGRRLVYLADDAAFPYGAWGEAELAAHIRALFRKAVAACRPCLAVIACNTASTLVLGELRADHPGTPFVGTVPAIKPAAERTASGLISVLATPGTVRRAYTEGLIRSFANHARVQLVGSPRLAAMAEASLRGRPVADGEVLDEIRPCFVEDGGARTDIVVLACTHYPFLANRFRRLAPWPVDWLDPAEAIVARAAALLPAGAAAGGAEVGAEVGSPDGSFDGPGAVDDPRPDLAVFTAGAPDGPTRALIRGFGLAAGTVTELAGRTRDVPG